MKILSLSVTILLLLCSNLNGQSDHEKDSLRFVTGFTVTKQQIKTISFEGTVDRKVALSAVLDKTRHFKVVAVRNPSNTGYHFDWQITETNNSIENKTFFFKEDDFFEVSNKNKQINVLENIDKLEGGSEIEILRSYLIADELLYGLSASKQSVHCTFEEDGEHFKMYNQEAADLLRIVSYNKKNLFPESTDLIKSYPHMTALDITSVRLNDIKINEELPNGILSLEDLLNQGYKVNLLNPVATIESPAKESALKESAPKAPILKKAFAQSNVNKLLKTDLETGKGWETTIGKFHDKSYLLLDFWFASSADSMDDLHVVQSLHRDFRKKGLRVFGVNCQDFDQKKSMVKKLKQKGITFTTLFGKNSNLKKWEISNIPTYVLLDSDGKIVLQGGSEILGEIRGFLGSVN